jgi:hypothetical protein
MKDELLSVAGKQSSAMLGKKIETFNSAEGEWNTIGQNVSHIRSVRNLGDKIPYKLLYEQQNCV